MPQYATLAKIQVDPHTRRPKAVSTENGETLEGIARSRHFSVARAALKAAQRYVAIQTEGWKVLTILECQVQNLERLTTMIGRFRLA